MRNLIELFENSYLTIFSGLGLIFCFVFPFIKSFKLLKMAIETRNWPSVKGIILESRIIEKKDKEGTLMFKLDIKYSFQIGQIKYQAQGRFLDEEPTQSWKGKLEEFVLKNQKNQEIDIYYFPENPHKSVLVRGAYWLNYLNVIGFLIFIISGILIVIKGLIDF